MHWLAGVSVRRPIFATVLMLVVVVLGLVGWRTLGVDRFPEVEFPMVSVTTVLPGASPQEMETEVSDRIEEAVGTIGGVEQIRSSSSEGVSFVFLQLDLGQDVDVAAQEVRDRVSKVLRDLPPGTEAPVVDRVDSTSAPIVYVSVDAPLPTRELTDVADRQVRRALGSVAGVGQVRVVGGRKREVAIRVDPIRLRAAGVSIAEIERAVAGQNLTVPGGRVENGAEQLTLRVRGRVGSPAAIGDLVIRDDGDHPLRVRDVATVEDGAAEVESVALRNGQPALLLAIVKQSGANTVATVDRGRERLEDIRPTLPSGYTLAIARDESATIRTSATAVTEHLVLGALFAAAVVLLFLGNLRSTVIAALAIPISIVGTFALMWWKGFTLNTITLLALALAVGIVIDDAIVVLENIVRHVEEKRLSPRRAAVAATREIALAVLATTLSLLAVFLPVAFMGGIVGRFLESFGLTMAFAIGVSMLVSFSLTPMLASRWLSSKRPHAATGATSQRTLLERVVDRFYQPIERAYVRVLGWAMRHRWVVVGASLAALASIVPLAGAVPKGFLPKSDEARFELRVRAPEGTSAVATALETERIARQVRRVPGVDSTLVTVAGDAQRTPNLGNVFVKLVDPDARGASQDELMEQVRRTIVARAPRHLRVTVNETAMFGGGGQEATIAYQLTGPDLERLEVLTNALLARLRRTPGAADVDSTLVSGKPELSASIDRERAASLGVDVASVASALRVLVGGTTISTYEEAGERYDVRLRAEPRFRSTPETLALLTVPSARGTEVALSDVVRLERSSGPAQIVRVDRRRSVTIFANVAPGHAEGEIVSALEREIAALGLPPGFHAAPVGRTKEMGKAATGFLFAFGLAFVFMYLVLAAQLESWLHPATILLALPLTLPFALLSLLVTGQALDIYSMLGLLVLFGVVKKNAILQIDHTNQLRAAGMGRLEAVLAANRDRLRPILMTTAAFVAGMLPLALSTGIGAGFNRATAGVIVGGQVLSLLLTLVATPVAYTLLDDLAARVRALRDRFRSARGVALDAPSSTDDDDDSIDATPVPLRASLAGGAPVH